MARVPSGLNNTYVGEVSTLLNTDNWTGFVKGEYAEYAIGGPTLEMWFASWNKHEDYERLYLNFTENGYFVGKEANPSTCTSIELTDTSGLYFSSEINHNYWLATVLANDSGGAAMAHFAETSRDLGCLFNNGMMRTLYQGLRPVVCLKKTIQLTWDAEREVYTLS